MSNLKKLVDSINESMKKFNEEALDAIKAEAKVLFDTREDLKTIAWVQYAPYFNDGEPCEFSVHDINASSTPVDNDEYSTNEIAQGEDGGVLASTCSWINRDKKDSAELREFIDALYSIPDNTMRQLFGDDSLVVITREGILIEEYEHV